MIELNSFITHIHEEHLIAEGQRVLLAVSGGRDSVTLLDLMCRAGYEVGVAHCNFHLRSGDCDRDEAFVRQLCDDKHIPCHVAQFDTLAYSSSHSLSVEEAARELRYAFFEEVRRTNGYDLVATAHHRDDAIETFFINLLRGTGIGGLHGIPSRNGVIVRPLLPFGRDEIDEYVSSRGLIYVEDSTNSQPLYMRNRIRLQLMPLMRQLSPSFDRVMWENMRRLAEADTIYKTAVGQLRERLVRSDGEKIMIDISQLRCSGPLQTVLFELLRPYGFNAAVASQVACSIDAQSGKQFFSPTHRLVKDRECLIVMPKGDAVEESFLLNEDCDTSSLPFSIEMSKEEACGKIRRLPVNKACFDCGKLQFPLVLRHWRAGDRFRPFGMKGTRLVSDLFNDHKLSLEAKEQVWLLCNGDGTVIWVVGYRAAHFAVVDGKTRTVLKLKIEK